MRFTDPVQFRDVVYEPIPVERIDYQVHLKYVSRLAALSKGLSIQTILVPKIGAAALTELRHKMQLLDMTSRLLGEEVQLITQDADYALACVAWLPAKVYYSLYHLLSVIEYMLTADRSALRIAHHVCLDGLAKRISRKEMLFSYTGFNCAYDKGILAFKSRSGEVLSQALSDANLLQLLMKKVAKDKLDDTVIRQRIDRRTVKGRKIYLKLQDGINVSIVDFFYLMRIRTNYKDMAFIDGIDAERARTYFLKYYEASNNFYCCLNDLKNELVSKIA